MAPQSHHLFLAAQTALAFMVGSAPQETVVQVPLALVALESWAQVAPSLQYPTAVL